MMRSLFSLSGKAGGFITFDIVYSKIKSYYSHKAYTRLNYTSVQYLSFLEVSDIVPNLATFVRLNCMLELTFSVYVYCFTATTTASVRFLQWLLR